MTTKIKVGEARAELRKMEAESVQTVVTSPPYWALRNYSAKDQIGLEETLQEHLFGGSGTTALVARNLCTIGGCSPEPI